VKKSTDAPASTTAKKPGKKIKKISSVYLAVVMVVVLLLGGAAIAYKVIDDSNKENAKLKEENARLANPQESAKLETERVKASVAQLIDVPEGEDPTIASVVDASKLSSQAFFKNAQNGDKVLMYAQAKKAILYRPGTNKIIEVAPINIGNNEKPAAPAGTETPQ